MWKMGWQICHNNKYGDYLFKTDSTIIHGKAVLSAATRHSSVAVRKQEDKIVSFLSLLQELLVQLIPYFVCIIQSIVTVVILSFCYVQKNTRKSKETKFEGSVTLPYLYIYVYTRS
jgi:hypothetical protein